MKLNLEQIQELYLKKNPTFQESFPEKVIVLGINL